MPDHFFAHRTWTDLRALLARDPQCVLILPTGSTEAHGPHLPLSTDVIIAEEMAIRAARKLEARGEVARVLPPITYSVTDFSEGFAGSISITAGQVYPPTAISFTIAAYDYTSGGVLHQGSISLASSGVRQ